MARSLKRVAGRAKAGTTPEPVSNHAETTHEPPGDPQATVPVPPGDHPGTGAETRPETEPRTINGRLAGVMERVRIEELHPAKYNPRRIEKRNLEALGRSIGDLGYFEPVVVNHDGTIISGHQRIAALKSAGVHSIDIIRVSVDKATERLMNLAANSRGLQGEWDKAALQRMLSGMDLQSEQVKRLALGQDKVISDLLKRMGFCDQWEKRRTGMGDGIFASDTPADKTKDGDIFQLGRHVLICGDSRDPAVYQSALTSLSARGKSIDRIGTVCTSPPYGVGLEYEQGVRGTEGVGGTGGIEGAEGNGGADGIGGAEGNGETQMATEDTGRSENLALVESVISQFAPLMADGGIVAWNVGTRRGFNIPADHSALLLSASLQYRDTIVWYKGGGYGQQYGVFIQNPYPTYYYPDYTCEYVLVYQAGYVGAVREVKGISGGIGGTGQLNSQSVPSDMHTDHWSIGTEKRKMGHPAVYPVRLPYYLLYLLARRDMPVLDPFAGSGSTMVAAELVGVPSILIEKSPEYCDIIRGRWSKFEETNGDSEWSPGNERDMAGSDAGDISDIDIDTDNIDRDGD